MTSTEPGSNGLYTEPTTQGRKVNWSLDGNLLPLLAAWWWLAPVRAEVGGVPCLWRVPFQGVRPVLHVTKVSEGKVSRPGSGRGDTGQNGTRDPTSTIPAHWVKVGLYNYLQNLRFAVLPESLAFLEMAKVFTLDPLMQKEGGRSWQRPG